MFRYRTVVEVVEVGELSADVVIPSRDATALHMVALEKFPEPTKRGDMWSASLVVRDSLLEIEIQTRAPEALAYL